MSSFFGNTAGTVTAAVKPKPQRKPPVQPPRKPVAASVQPDLTEPPIGQPVPVLQQVFGYHGGIGNFNQRLQAVTDAHMQQTGVKPDPATALHAALATPPAQAHNLFAPSTPAAQALQQHPPVTDQQFVQQMRQAAKSDGWDQWLQQNGDRVQELTSDKQWSSKVHGIVLAANAREGALQRAENAGLTPEEAKQAVAHKQKADALGLVDPGLIARPIAQIANALVHSPGGVFNLAKAVDEDTADAFAYVQSGRQVGNVQFKRSRTVGKQIIQSTAQDFEHPKENAGYLFLDLLGLTSAGAGVVARAGAAGAAFSEAGEEASAAARVGAAAKAAARKPALQRATLNLGGYDEDIPLSQNPLVAQVQKRILGAKQTRADARLAGNTPTPLLSIVHLDKAQEWLDKNLSFERKVGRESEARMRVDHTAAMALANELDAAAGTALAQSRVLGKLPVTLKRGLSRGEQKAIQALSWGIVNPIEVGKAFHQRMIDMGVGSKKAHQRQIADLTLAAKVLANPRPRFQQALDLTREVIAEQQRMKVQDLGLAPEAADQHLLDVAHVLLGHAPSEDELIGEGFYLPSQPRGKVKRRPSQVRGTFGVSAGPYGVPLGRDLPELTHSFDGDSLRAGDYRIDATSLASEAYARTVRAMTVKNQWNKLWDAASPSKRGFYDIPIRDSNTIPDALRTVIAKLDEGNFTQADAELLPQDMADLIRALYPNEKDLTPEEIDGVRWIDGRLLGDQLGMPKGPLAGAGLFNAINTPFRFTALYLRPAYALNKLGNQAMLVFDQGFLNSLQNNARALAIEKTDGVRNAETIRALVGGGRSRSYVTGKAGAVSKGLAEFWNRFADRDERTASWLYYADRKGYKTAADRDRLLNDPANKADLEEVARRANKALVEFDNLTSFEKNTLRHIIFVYPWVRGATVWSLRAIMEHPLKTAILAKLGEQELQNDPILDHAPDWFKRAGYFPVGWNHDGTPKVVNPSSINTFQTLDELLNVGKGATIGDKTETGEDLLGPGAKFAIHAVIGRDEYGNLYPGSQWLGAAKEVLLGLPQLSKLKSKKQQPTKQFNVTDRASLEASLNSALHQTVLSPGWLGGFGSLITGGLTPKNLSLPTLAAEYWRDADPKLKHQRELNLLNTALNYQGTFLKRPVADGVRKAVRDGAQITYLAGQFRKQMGRSPTAKEHAGIVLDYLTNRGAIPKSTAGKLQARLKPLDDPTEISAFQTMLLDKYGSLKQLRQWDSDVRLVASFTKHTFNEKAARLFQQGLSPQKTYQHRTQDQLYDYGRKYLAFTEKVKQTRADIKAGKATVADLRLLTDENSQPVDGMPSFAAISWANQTPEEQRVALLKDASAGWDTLTAVEKTLLGKHTNPDVTEAWRAYDILTSKTELAKQLPAGQRSLDKDQRLAVVKQIDRYYRLKGSFTSDYLFSKEPLSQRLPYLDVVKNSPNRQDWREVLQQADTLEKAVQNQATTQAVADDTWDDYVTGQLEPFLKSDRPAFWQELKPILAASPNFLRDLVRAG